MRKIILTILVVMLLGACSVQAVTEWQNGHYDVVDGNYFEEVAMLENATADMIGGLIDKITIYQSCLLNMYDGEIGILWTEDISTANIYGGDLTELWATGGSVNLYAYDVTHTTTGGLWDDGQVIGTYYSDSTDFIFDLRDDAYSHISIIPEPATFLLLGLGGLLLRKRK